MDNQLNSLLYDLPPGVDYTEDLISLDEKDIPIDRIPKLLALLNCDDENAVFRAAFVLCCWGNKAGFEYMRAFVLRQPPPEGWHVHRLRNYDNTLEFVLRSLVKYWARNADQSSVAGHQARESIVDPINRLIQLSEAQPFEISSFFWLVEEEGFVEYLPALKSHLQAIIKEPQKHHWKVADCAHLLMKFDPDFVTRTLATHGYTLADFPNK